MGDGSFPTKPRAAILWFANYMELKLQKNDHKGSDIEDGTLEYARALDRLEQEVRELKRAVVHGEPSDIILEAADVANFALAIARAAKTEHHP